MSTAHLEHDIRVHLADYLAGEASLQQLEDWLVPATWDAHGDSGEQLSSRILLHIAEHDDGWLSEDALKDLLRPLASIPLSSTLANSRRT